jgi:hypothetical protein
MKMIRKEIVPDQFKKDKEFFFEMKYKHYEERRNIRLNNVFKVILYL